MFWCHSCSNNFNCSNSCSICHSQAVQIVTSSNDPKNFEPYVIEQKQQEEFYSLDSLYRTVYRDLLETARERIPEQVRRVTENGNQEIRYVYVLNASEEDQVRGLSADEIQQLQTKTLQKQCTICQQSRQAEGFVLECKHEFHQECLTPWITTNATCPTCRFKLINQ